MEYGENTEEMSDHSGDEDWQDTQWSTGGPLMSLDDKYKPGVQEESMVHAAPDKRDVASCGKDPFFQPQKSSQLLSRMQLNDNKAGMVGLDKDVINQIIYEASKGSKFFENEKKKEEQVLQRIQEQEKRRQKITEAELKKGIEEADKLVAQIKANLDLSQTVVHVDMDAFYAAVEMKDNPSLRNRPMAVGGVGMLSTSNYEARKFGVRAAMPGFIGRKLCPQLVIVPPNFAKYTSVSHQIREVFARYDPGYCPVSLDEAYLNFTAHLEKRCSFPPEQRTFLRRCQSPPDAALCCCDLNETLQTSVLNKRSRKGDMRTVLDRETGRDNVFLDAETSCYKMEDGFLERMEGFSDGVAFSASSHLLPSSEHSLLVSRHRDVEAGSVLVSKALAVVNVASQASSSKAHYQVTPTSNDQRVQVERNTEIEGPEVGTVCLVCSKKIPAYEVVTFGTDAESAVQEMRCRIEQHTLLTASAGIAPNMMLAKVCSDQNKPNGQFILPPDYNTIMDFVYRLPIRKISGIGRVSEQLLKALGISNCSDLFRQRALLYHLYSPVSFKYFMRIACGVGSTHVVRDEDRKSMSTEQTFQELSQPQELYDKCLELCQYLASDLASEGLLGKTVSLKLKTVDFQVRTRAHTISSYTNDVETIFSVARGILQAEIQAEMPKTLRLRLMGVRMAKLISESECRREKQESIVGFFQKAPEKMSSNKAKLNAFGDSQVVNSPDNTKNCSDLEEGCLSYHTDVSSESLDKPVGGEDNPVVRRAISPGKAKPGERHWVSTLSMKLAGEPMCHHVRSDEYAGGQVSISKDTQECSTKICKTRHDEVISSDEQSSNNDMNAGHDSALHVELKDDANDWDSCSVRCVKDCNSLVDNKTDPMHENEESQTVHEPRSTSSLGSTQWSAQTSRPTDEFSSQSGCEQAHICPVCFKHVNCINLVVFNDHIDKCLLLGTSDGSSKNKREEISQTQQQKAKLFTSKKSRKQGKEKKLSLTQKQLGELPSRSESGAACGQSKVSRTSEGVPVRSSTGCVHAGESLAGEEPIEYMVCPLCGAERADWTLETFNQHVDTCLNRETISQILKEQKNEEHQRKRPPSDSQESEFCSQGAVKRPKKTPPPKNRKSILSFFKSNAS